MTTATSPDGASAPAPPLPASAREYLDELASLRRLSPHTRTAYERDLRLLAQQAAAAGMEDLTRLTGADLRRFAGRLHAGGLAATSIARTLSAWRSYFRWLGQRGAVAANPASGVRAPRRPARLPKALAPDQAVQLAAFHTDDSFRAVRDHAIVELFYSSGLRLAELAALDYRFFDVAGSVPRSRGWIDLEAREVTVTGKGERTRMVPLGAAAFTALKTWLAARAAWLAARKVPLAERDARALFLSERGRRLAARTIETRVALLARRAGLPMHVHPHMLRHSMASHVLQSSGDLRAVQELLGHASISATQIYTSLDWQHLAKVYDATHPRARIKAEKK
ncbi:MAG TPA: tyrosine recombinase XerC [Burkholderiaceae bacterium]|nr:tyrosine recombinase XerC [Burkholderiaceae bacterium]